MPPAVSISELVGTRRRFGQIVHGTFIRAVTFVSRVAGVVAALLIGFAVLVICDMVIERYVFNLTTIWQIDVVTY